MDSGSPESGEQISNSISTRKTRAAFSEEQMNALIHRFNIQIYLTPTEKTLAGATGLMYKQVKTWFQNRRIKLKRHQRDTTQDPYSNPQVREPVFKRSPPQTLFYSSYPQPRSPTQATARPPGNWPVPPAVMHYEFPSPASYMQARDGSNAANKEGSPAPSMSSAAQGTAKGMTLL
uniref:Homeobox domain-containing protein n=1 Tax=Sinocyclocheilus grahami TaxID=75366 RepID=A0A672PII1_SINGR